MIYKVNWNVTEKDGLNGHCDKDTKSYANSQDEEFQAEHDLGGEFWFRWPPNPHPERGCLLSQQRYFCMWTDRSSWGALAVVAACTSSFDTIDLVYRVHPIEEEATWLVPCVLDIFQTQKITLCLSKKRSLTDVDGRDLCPTSFLPRLANMSSKSLVIDWLSSLSLKSCREAAWSPWRLGIACERRPLHLYLHDSDSSSSS